MSVAQIHLANLLCLSHNDEISMKKLEEGSVTTLETFWKKSALVKLFEKHPKVKVFLDSGAHSLLNAQMGLIHKGDTVKTEKKASGEIEFTDEDFSQLEANQRVFYSAKKKGTVQLFADWSFNKNPDVRKYLDEYIEFIYKYKDRLTGDVNLDIIFNAEESWENQCYMEKRGLRPIPVFHYGEDFKWLRQYAKNYDYIGIGGVATGTTMQQFVVSIGDPSFKYIAEASPDLKVHGFAVTSYGLMKKYKFFSVDSTSWCKIAGYGGVMIPAYDDVRREFTHSVHHHVISVSDISEVKHTATTHYTQAYDRSTVKKIEEYFEMIGTTPEKLRTLSDERRRANVIYYESLLKSGCLQEKEKPRPSVLF